MNKSLRTGLAAGMGGAVLVAGLLVGASIALADDTTEPSENAPTSEFRFGSNGEHHRHLDDLAAELGVDIEELQQQLAEGATLEEIAESLDIDLVETLESIKQKALAAIDERVAAGELNQERADQLKERVESLDPAEFPFGPDGLRDRVRGSFEFGRGFGPSVGGFFGDLDLGIDLSELRDRLESGMSLEDALAEAGVDVDDLLTGARASALARIDELVEAGTLTDERAAQLREMIESFELDSGFAGLRGFAPGESRRGHHGPGFGFFGSDSESGLAEGTSA